MSEESLRQGRNDVSSCTLPGRVFTKLKGNEMGWLRMDMWLQRLRQEKQGFNEENGRVQPTSRVGQYSTYMLLTSVHSDHLSSLHKSILEQ
eukprot:scaffold242359_cov16-Tisochrysis_lutea.AAC.1